MLHYHSVFLISSIVLVPEKGKGRAVDTLHTGVQNKLD